MAVVHTLNPTEWVNQYADYLFHYAKTRINDVEEAEDLVQETFLAAYRGKDNFKGNASEKTWLTSILKRKVIDHYRKKSSGSKEMAIGNFFQEDDDENPGAWKAEHLPQNKLFSDKDLENEELRNALEGCIGKLPEKYKAAFSLKYLSAVETEEIGKELGLSSSNLWVILHRARIQLRECLQKNWF